ncbi:MAG: hypothetical protein JO272_04075 [Pseudonocardiales bacterium]|nr:hypothetical protein [Pseudonocardiales bacterium]
MDINQILTTGDEQELHQVWSLQSQRSTWQTVINKSGAQDTDHQIAIQALDDLPEVTALQALEANRRLVDLLMGRRWIVIQKAREEGASWNTIGKALSMSCQAARDWYRRKITEQEKYLGDRHDATRARLAL